MILRRQPVSQSSSSRSRRASIVASFIVTATLAVTPAAHALDNGLARTPPMGFNDWNAVHCDVNEQFIEQTADFLVSSGMKDARYEYVNIDDCWMTHERDASGRLVPDPARFPNGIAGTAAYVHAKGLKLGIYAERGHRHLRRLPRQPGPRADRCPDVRGLGRRLPQVRHLQCRHRRHRAATADA